MAVSALIRFVQGPNSDIAGRAVKGTIADGAVTVSNGSNSGVVTWKYELLFVPPGSAVSLSTQGPNATSTFTFTPDVAGTYRVRLTVVGTTASDVDQDIRCFCVPFANGFISPPYQRNPDPLPVTGAGAKPDEMNLGGQAYGWSGDNDTSRKLLHQALQAIDPNNNAQCVSIASYGAVPNDSSKAATNTAAIQAAITAATTSPARWLFIPSGTWWTNELVLSGDIQIIGVSLNDSIIRYAKTSGDLFSYPSTAGNMRGTVVQDLRLEGAGRTAGTHVAFRGRHLVPSSTSNRGVNFVRVRVSEFFTGLIINDSYNVSLDSCEIVGNGNIGALTGGGFKFERVNFGDVSSTGSTFRNCLVESNSRGVYTDDDVNDQVLNCLMEETIFEGNGYGVWFKRSSLFKVIGCYFEANTTRAIFSSQLTAISCSQYPPTELTTDAFEVSAQLVELHRRYFRIKYGATTLLEVQANDTEQTVNLVSDQGGIKIGPFGNVRLYTSSGSPEGVVVADIGSLCVDRTSTSSASFIYCKTTSGSNTGWSLVSTPILSGTTVQRPAAGSVSRGTSYYNSDTFTSQVSNGINVWREYNGQQATAVTLSQLPPSEVAGARCWLTDTKQLVFNDSGTYRTIFSNRTFIGLANGGTTTFQAKGGRVTNITVGTIASHTFALPDASYAKGGDECVVETRGEITSATFSSSLAIVNAPSSLIAGSTTRFVYDSNGPLWLCVQSSATSSANTPRLLHFVRRTALVSNVTSRATIAYDSSVKAVNTAYLTYSSGVWTAVQACAVNVTAEISFVCNAGAVAPTAILALYRGSGGSQNTLVQEQSTSVYSTTNASGQLVVTCYMSLAANDQFRVTIEANAGVDTLANRSTVRVMLDS